MLTPQEVAEHAFQKASFGGYNMAMVDEFLDQVTADYTSLYKENATLKAKMKVLADKIEEYRSTEEAMRKAMLSAQRMADQMVAEAEEKVDTIIAEAEAAPDSYEWRLTTVSAFKEEYAALKRYDVAQIGRALDKLGYKMQRPRIDWARPKLRELPCHKWGHYDAS